MIKLKLNSYYSTLLVLLLVLISCEKNELFSGLEGIMYKGPINPVAIEGQINDAPFSALFHVYNEENIVVKSFSSNNKGEFSVVLNAGTYFVKPDKSAPILRPELQIKEISIVTSDILRNDFYFDTGIR